MWERLNILQKLTLGFVMVIFLTSIVGAVAYVSLNKVEIYLHKNMGQEQPLTNVYEQIRKINLEIESDLNRLLLTEEGNIQGTIYEIKGLINQVEQAATYTQDDVIKQILNNIKLYFNKYNEFVNRLTLKDLTTSDKQEYIKYNISLASHIRSLTDKLYSNIHKKIIHDSTVSLGMVKQAKSTLFVFILLTLITSIIVSFILANKLTDPLILLSQKAER